MSTAQSQNEPRPPEDVERSDAASVDDDVPGVDVTDDAAIAEGPSAVPAGDLASPEAVTADDVTATVLEAGSADDAASGGGEDAPATELRDEPGSPGVPRPPHPRNPTTVVAVTVVLLLVLALVALYIDHRNAPSTTSVATRSAGGATAAPVAPDASNPPSADSLEAELVTRGSVHDDFERTANGLGMVPFGPTWVIGRGEWSADGKQAVVKIQAPNELALASINGVGQNVTMEVALPKAEAGAALMFRGINAQTYWLVAIDASGVVAYHVVDGKPTVVGGPTPVAITSGMKLGVDANKEAVRVFVDGKSVLEFKDPEATGRALGLATAPNAASTVTFDNLRYRAH